MKNDNKARDIFYGVIAIATLIVAIVGATLAYFSVTANSANGAVNATAKIVSIEYNDGQQVSAQAKNLIPATLDVVKKVYERNIKSIDSSTLDSNAEITANACIDDNSEEVCSTYRFTVRSDVTKEITAALKNEHNGFTYLGYAVYDVTDGEWLKLNDSGAESLPLNMCSNENEVPEGEADAIPDCYTIDNTTTVKNYDTTRAVNSIFGTTIPEGAEEVRFKTESVSSTAHVYDLVLFIRENRGNQNIDQGKTYRGTIVVDVVGSDGEITGTINE